MTTAHFNMILIQDNYFDEKIFSQIKEYAEQDFQIIKLGEKEFSALPTPTDLLPILNLKGYKLILTFIRSAHKDFDNELRIHADNVINNEKSDLASVFYISGNEVSKNGTAFYKHHYYGKKLPKDISNKDFDQLITEDSKDRKKWTIQDIVVSVPNRMLTYDSNYFHSKFPEKIDTGVRKVMVCFYKKINQ